MRYPAFCTLTPFWGILIIMKKTTKRGFTLIELLVVISIMGLLSSVVLSSVQRARKKADDTQRNQIVGEYVKALALAFKEVRGVLTWKLHSQVQFNPPSGSTTI